MSSPTLDEDDRGHAAKSKRHRPVENIVKEETEKAVDVKSKMDVRRQKFVYVTFSTGAR